jgi:DNA-binding NarL/FixJ family response regulator
MKEYKLVIVDDHEMFRSGLNFILSDIPNIKVIAQAANGVELLDVLQKDIVDIILMDINMPVMNGVEATIEALKINPKLKIIALSMHGEEEYYDQMLEAGVKGFLLKNSGVAELKLALDTIIADGRYFSQDLLVSIINKKKEDKSQSELVKLTKRELEVLKLICKGHCNNEIAELLFISNRTVDRHRSNLLSKTSCHNSTSLVMYAVKNKIVEI